MRYFSSERRPGWSNPAWERPRGVSEPGDETADGKDPAENNRRDVEIKLGGGSKGDGRVLGDGGILQADPEHGRIVYRYAITVIPV